MRLLVITMMLALLATECPTDEDPLGGEHTLTVTVAPEGAGTVSPDGGTFEDSTQVELTASANEGYAFSDWSGDLSSTDNPLSFTITGDTDLTANFEETGGGSEPQAFEEPLTVTDGENTADLLLGMDASATDGYDEGLDEEAPPAPPEGAFYAQFLIDDRALLADYRPVTGDPVEWTLEFAPKEGLSVTLSWDLSGTNHVGDLLLVDDPADPSVEIDMKAESSYDVPASTTTLYILSN